MRAMEKRLDLLIQSNENIVKMINALDSKVNLILETENRQNERSSPKNGTDCMCCLEISNKLDNIRQYVSNSSQTDCRTIRPELLDQNQLQLIKHFSTAIDNANERMRNFTQNLNQVIEGNRNTLEKVTNLSQAIDERIRSYDSSYRQFDEVGSKYESRTSNNTMNNKPCNNTSLRVLNNSEASERTYQNMKRSTNGVQFEPQKYNCHDLKVRRNGVYKFASQDEVANEASRFFYERFCDFNSDGVAWTVIQNRYVNDNSENFNRTWMDYKLGFGELDKEFWFGNDFIHQLTSDEDVELRIILEYNSGRKRYFEYSLFKVDSEQYNYNLQIGGYRGSPMPENFLSYNDQDFSTYDRQNDNNGDISCASAYGSGWWFNDCTELSHRDYKYINGMTWLGGNNLKS